MMSFLISGLHKEWSYRGNSMWKYIYFHPLFVFVGVFSVEGLVSFNCSSINSAAFLKAAFNLTLTVICRQLLDLMKVWRLSVEPNYQISRRWVSAKLKVKIFLFFFLSLLLFNFSYFATDQDHEQNLLSIWNILAQKIFNTFNLG